MTGCVGVLTAGRCPTCLLSLPLVANLARPRLQTTDPPTATPPTILPYEYERHFLGEASRLVCQVAPMSKWMSALLVAISGSSSPLPSNESNDSLMYPIQPVSIQSDEACMTLATYPSSGGKNVEHDCTIKLFYTDDLLLSPSACTFLS